MCRVPRVVTNRSDYKMHFDPNASKSSAYREKFCHCVQFSMWLFDGLGFNRLRDARSGKGGCTCKR